MNWTFLANLLITLGAVLGAVGVMVKPLKTQMDGIVKRELQNQENENRIQKIEKWTQNQQNDIDELNRGVVTSLQADYALLDHAIEKQGGNGKCHKARDSVELYLKQKSLGLNSHK